MRRVILLLLSLSLTCAVASAQTLFYLNFDQTTASDIPNGTTYTLGSSEISAPWFGGLGTLTFNFLNYNGDGPSIGPAPVGMSGTAQGGNVLLVNGCGGQDEGLQIFSKNGLAPQDFTMEAVWFTSDTACVSNTASLQSIIGDEWPTGERANFFIRIAGPDLAEYLSNQNEVQLSGTGVNQPYTWYHDVLVFDYNESDPANSTILAYRNESLVGQQTFDASSISVALFPSVTPGRRLAVGFGNQLEAGLYTDHRGLTGGIDAIAVSLGALTPGQFLLPAGPPPPPAEVNSVWQMYN